MIQTKGKAIVSLPEDADMPKLEDGRLKFPIAPDGKRFHTLILTVPMIDAMGDSLLALGLAYCFNSRLWSWTQTYFSEYTSKRTRRYELGLNPWDFQTLMWSVTGYVPNSVVRDQMKFKPVESDLASAHERWKPKPVSCIFTDCWCHVCTISFK